MTAGKNLKPERGQRTALQQGQGLLRAVIEGITDPIFVKDREGRYLMMNAAGAGLLGRREEETLGREDTALFPLELAREFKADDRKVLESGEPLTREETIDLTSGTKTFLTTKVAYRDERDEIVGLIGIARDITERERALRAVRESEERLRNVVDSAMDAIVTIDDQSLVRLFNPAAEDVFHADAEEVLGRSFNRFASGELLDLLACCRRAFGRSGNLRRYVWAPDGLHAVRADGEAFPLEATISAAVTAGERLYTLILRDVSTTR